MLTKTTVSQLRPGDTVVYHLSQPDAATVTVAAVQPVGPLVILDLTDGTSTPPIPGRVAVWVQR